MTGVVYTETVVHSAPEALASHAPYQLAIGTLDGGGRLTARIEGVRVVIGDAVRVVRSQDGIFYFRREE